jgi:hypothetical protein
MSGCFPVSPDDEVRQIFFEVGVLGLWQEAFKNEAANAQG